MSAITVYKLDANGNTVLRYPGEVIERGESWVHLKATFQVPQADLGPVSFWQGDTFHEWFYADRWYNIFRVEAGDTGTLRAWYCNITRPAHITADAVRSDDLALDVLILPGGDIHLMDQDEFHALALPPQERDQAWQAVTDIRRRHAQTLPPFGFAR